MLKSEGSVHCYGLPAIFQALLLTGLLEIRTMV